ncbi:MAG TPA: glycosyltransferase, partial [Novosphingobium sp.]|nr:glycosyltransferase [Novosphingobium sp.]
MPHRADHILICFHDFSRGGTERIAIGLARHWAEQGRRVTILCGTTEGGLRATVDARVQVVELDPPVRRSLTSRLKLGKAMAAEIARLKPDIIFLPGNFHLPLAPAFARIPGRVEEGWGAIMAKISNPSVPDGLAAAPVRWLLRRFGPCVDGWAAMNSG